MKRTSSFFAVAVALFVPLFVGAPADAEALASNAAPKKEPTAYSMYCRGGGSMNYEMFPKGSSTRTLHIRVGFERGKQGAKAGGFLNVSRVDPGHCTWGDRGMNSDEPKLLTTYASSHAADIATFQNVGECTRDEHCVFVFRVYRDGHTMRAVNRNRVDFWRVP
jgi:hypothetical protein